MNKLLGISIVLGAWMFFSSCEEPTQDDVCRFENGEIHCYSRNSWYAVDLEYFMLSSRPEELIYNDSITMDDAVQTSNTGFTSKRLDLLEVEKMGNYEIRTYLFKGYFTVYVTSCYHQMYYRYLPFEYEAQEFWLNDRVVVQNPLVFENVDCSLSELPVSDEEKNKNVYAKYLLVFDMNVYYGYDGDTIGNFKYNYIVTRYNESVWYEDNEDVTITVTYDWQPE